MRLSNFILLLALSLMFLYGEKAKAVELVKSSKTTVSCAGDEDVNSYSSVITAKDGALLVICEVR